MIDLAKLRADLEAERAGTLVVIGGITDSATVLALVEAVEAARVIMDAGPRTSEDWGTLRAALRNVAALGGFPVSDARALVKEAEGKA